MSKFTLLVAAATVFVSAPVFADEVSESKSTQVDAPGYSANSSTTTTARDEAPATVEQRSTTTEEVPGQKSEVSTKRTYSAPRQSRTTTRHTETNVSP